MGKQKPAGSFLLASRSLQDAARLSVCSVQEGGRLGPVGIYARATLKISAPVRGRTSLGPERGEAEPAPVRAPKCFDCTVTVPSPGGKGGVIIIKQHLHRDFACKALSQGWEALGWLCGILAGRPHCWLVPPPAKLAIECLGNKALFIQLFPIPLDFHPSPLSPMKSSLGACHSGQKRDVRSSRQRGWLGLDRKEGGRREVSLPLHPCPAPTHSGLQGPANQSSLSVAVACNS